MGDSSRHVGRSMDLIDGSLESSRALAASHEYACERDKEYILLFVGSIEPDSVRMLHWFCCKPIYELDACAAEHFVNTGQGRRGITFLIDTDDGWHSGVAAR